MECKYRMELLNRPECPVSICAREAKPDYQLFPGCENPAECEYLLTRQEAFKEVGEWLEGINELKLNYYFWNIVLIEYAIKALKQGKMPGEVRLE